MKERSYTERIWYRDDITQAQRRALRTLRDAGPARELDMRGVRLSTLRALHRFGLVKADQDPIEPGTVVTITRSGKESISDGN